MKHLIFLAPLILLTGCPANVQQQAAQASLNASIVVKNAQVAEKAAAVQGLISSSDDKFIQQQFDTIGQIGLTVDNCISAASNRAGTISCLSTAVTNLDTIYTNGGLYLKSATALNDFNVAVSGVRSVLAGIEATLGGTVPPLPAQANAGGAQ